MIKKLLLFLVFILFTSNIIYSTNVEVFSTYNTNIKLNNDNTLDINKTMFLRNIHSVAIIPGQVDFKIMTSEDIKILKYSLKDRYEQDISSNILNTQDFSIIQTKLFTPLLPGFEYKIDFNYKLSIQPKGIFFKKLKIPLKENTRIDIRSGEIILEIPDKYYFTYLSYKDNTTIIDSNKVTWQINENTPDILEFEYSYIPLRIPGISGSVLFWLLINIVLILILIKEVKKEIKKYHKK